MERGLEARSVYIWDEHAGHGAVVNVFQAGPFRIGYLGFPVGGCLGETGLDDDLIATWRSTRSPLLPDCLRLPISAFDPPTSLHGRTAQTPETAVVGLGDWHLQAHAAARRDVAKARRHGTVVVDASDPAHADLMYRLYRETLSRHRGNMRYTREYFHELLRLSAASTRLRCLLAVHDGEAMGFLVAALHRSTGYYLHAGTDQAHKPLGTMDLLMGSAIEWAQRHGAQQFNLMASPPGQPTLVRYKEKWGGTTRTHTTLTVAIRPLTCRMFHIAERIYQILT
jgi:GNAT superfamily N-acetyltransferase